MIKEKMDEFINLFTYYTSKNYFFPMYVAMIAI